MFPPGFQVSDHVLSGCWDSGWCAPVTTKAIKKIEAEEAEGGQIAVQVCIGFARYFVLEGLNPM